MALVFTALIALPLGIAGGLMAGRWPDKLALYAASIFVSMRNFWLAIVLALVVTAELGWIPSIDYQNIAYAILPAFVIAIEMSSLFARTLIDARELTVMTNSLDIAAFLAQAPGLRVKTTPGWVRANDNALIGGDTASVVRRFVFDAVFMGIAACDPDHGWMDCADEESELRRVLIEQTRQPVVLADDGKLGRHASIRTFALTTRLIVVANRPIGRPFDEIFTSAGVEVRHRRRSS